MSRGETLAFLHTGTTNADLQYSAGIEVRFSSEDSFRSDLLEILNLYKACDKAGVHRV